jgi:hypothetical protein
MYWIIGRKSELSLANKLLIYKTILKPIWTYGIPLWGTATNSNIEILRFQNKVLRSIANAPWYVPNTLLHTDLQIPTVKAEIPVINLSNKYREKLTTSQRTHNSPTRRRATEIKTLQTNRTNNKILISTAHSHESFLLRGYSMG